MLLELHCICNSHHRAVVGNKTSLEQHSDAKKMPGAVHFGLNSHRRVRFPSLSCSGPQVKHCHSPIWNTENQVCRNRMQRSFVLQVY